MRQIKFRAWDKENKRMYQLGCLADCLFTTSFAEDYGNDMTKYEFIQFTGLLDKNGKEIYEGDIFLREEMDEVFRVDSIFPVHRHTHVTNIGWMDKDGFNPRTEPAGQHDNMDDWMSWPEMYEVIGNIYENPELIK